MLETQFQHHFQTAILNNERAFAESADARGVSSNRAANPPR
jgi:hypothetical protein